ncbi:alpha/beta-hydrolase [Schizophyllum commune H4-8]|uniref:alpha/beta-hydrolase n=1 Tax=Schizophyllum commune (strain H4-8 / FGSC 9210) TaxID=578458 RepID=UPI00215FACE4|nr:alpha/beta-hydrolase [Schizophyllum commune H4-8]KAI5891571.1 alpha/beta-hydrolase [Schizophyllum commune H4-8]
MERVEANPETTIVKISMPTITAFVPIHEAKRAEIECVPRKTFQYGSTERHKLDVYYPIAEFPGTPRPVLFFYYGGGFTAGSRQLPPPMDVGYGFLGAYFAARGFITVIPDYRLVPQAKYPDGGRDALDALLWAVEHPSDIRPGSSEVGALFVLAHSAGAAHVCTALLHQDFDRTPLGDRLRGVVLVGAPYRILDDDIVYRYYGGEARARATEPLGLYESASDEEARAFARLILMAEAEREPQDVREAGDEFEKALEKKGGKRVNRIVAKRHNHISMIWALGTGDAEEWAEEALGWIMRRCAHRFGIAGAFGLTIRRQKAALQAPAQ